MREYIAVTNILIRVKVICIDICGLSSTGKSHDLINRKPWQGLNSVRLRESVFRWMTATERILLCMTSSSMSRNAVVVSEIIEKMHIWGNESYKGGSNPPSIFSLSKKWSEKTWLLYKMSLNYDSPVFYIFRHRCTLARTESTVISSLVEQSLWK